INEKPKMNENTNNSYVGGKRYLVRLQNTYELEQVEVYGEGDLVFETTELPFTESIGTTQDIESNGDITYNAELWSYGMGLLHDDESHKYTHNTSNFKIYNAGINIHPFEQMLEIKIENVSKGYELKNNTT